MTQIGRPERLTHPPAGRRHTSNPQDHCMLGQFTPAHPNRDTATASCRSEARESHTSAHRCAPEIRGGLQPDHRQARENHPRFGAEIYWTPQRLMTPIPRLGVYFHVHLVSDSTGETLNAMTKAVCARFDDVLPIEHIYPLVRSSRQLERVLREIGDAPGMVVHTIIDSELRSQLEDSCRRYGAPCIAALDPLTAALGRYLGAQLSTRVGAQHALDSDYFNRIEALNYAIGHDDGQGGQNLDSADVILVGVSRTSKTPTSIYLAHRGVRAANVPLVPGAPLPEGLFTTTKALIVGLVVSPDRLIQIRRNRLLSLNENRDSAYIDADSVRDEILQARRLFDRQDWPVIDVSRRSVEETAAAVINLLNAHRAREHQL